MKPKDFIWFCIKWPLFLAWSLFVGAVAHSFAAYTQFDAPWYAWSLIMSAVSISAFAGYRAKVVKVILEAFGKEFERVGTRFNQIEALIEPTASEPPAEDPIVERDLKCEHCSRPMKPGAVRCVHCWRKRT